MTGHAGRFKGLSAGFEPGRGHGLLLASRRFGTVDGERIFGTTSPQSCKASDHQQSAGNGEPQDLISGP